MSNKIEEIRNKKALSVFPETDPVIVGAFMLGFDAAMELQWDKILELQKEIIASKEQAINDYLECVNENGEDNPICNIYTSSVMNYGIVLMKIKNIYTPEQK